MLSDQAIDTIFRTARTHRAWQDRDVSDEQIRIMADLLKYGPTASNTCPARFVFIKSSEAKEKLRPHLDAGNVERTMLAPVTAIIAYDLKFYEKMDKLAPHSPDARSWFEGKEKHIQETAFRSGTLQGAYLIIAARALGLDCGPMSGFNVAGVKGAFFPDQDVVPNFLCNIGYGDPAKLHGRAPRLDFNEYCTVL